MTKLAFLIIVIGLVFITPTCVNAQKLDSITDATVGSNNIPNNSSLIFSPNGRAIFAFLVSFLSVIVIVWITNLIMRRLRKYDPRVTGTFWDIIRIRDNYPNLGVFQFLIWSFVIMFSFAGVFLVRILNGFTSDDTFQNIPYNILTILGISAIVCVISIYLSRDKYYPPRPIEDINKEPTDKKADETKIDNKETAENKLKRILPIFEMMLEDNYRISLPKFQMFFWTWIIIAIYLIGLFSQTSNLIYNVGALAIPDIHPAFVIIMAVSQGAFVVNSLMSQRTIKIIYVKPTRPTRSDFISIFGTNFGTTLDKGAVWIENENGDRDIRVT